MWVLKTLLGFGSGVLGKAGSYLITFGLIGFAVLWVYSAGGDAQRVAQVERQLAAERAEQRALNIRLERRERQLSQLQDEIEGIDDQPTVTAGDGADCRISSEFVRAVLRSYDPGGSS